MEKEDKLLQDIFNSNKGLTERIEAFGAGFLELNEKEVTAFLNTKLAQTQQDKIQSGKSTNFIEFLIAVNRKYLLDPEFGKEFLKFLFELMKSNSLPLKTKVFKKLSKTLRELLVCEKNNVKKMVAVAIQKLDIHPLETLLHMLSQCPKVAEDVSEQVKKRVQTVMGSLEKNSVTFRGVFLNFCNTHFIDSQIVAPLKKLLVDKHFHIAYQFLSGLEQKDIEKIEKRDELLTNSLFESLVLEEKIQQNCFEIMKILLASEKEYTNAEKVSTFIDGFTKKLYKKESPFMSYHFCDIICRMHISGLKNHKKVFEKYFQSNLFMPPSQQNEVQSKFLKNHSFLASTPLMKFLVESQKINTFKGNYFYSILDSLRESKQQQDLVQQKLDFIKAKEEQNKDKPITIANYQNFIYCNVFHLESTSEQVIINQLLMKGSFLFNKNLFNLLTCKEAYYLLLLLVKVSDKLSQQKDTANVSLLLLKVIQSLGSFSSKALELPPFLLKLLMKGIFIFNVYIDQQLEEKLESNLVMFLINQKNLAELLAVKNNLLSFLKIISFSKLNQPLRQYFIQHKLVKKNIGLSSDLQFKEIQFILKQDNIRNTDEDKRTPYLNFLQYVIYFFPNIIETLSLFYHTNVLSKLTRMQRINTSLSKISYQNVWEITKEDFEALGNFGYRELTFKESQSQEVDIEDVFKFERDLEQTQDEEYLELETFDKQDIILDEYHPLLSRINDSIQLFAQSFSQNLTETHQNQLHLFNTLLHESFLQAKHGSHFTQKVFETVFNIHIIAQNKELTGLATIYCHVIQKDEQGPTIRRIEGFIDKISPEIYKLFDLKLFEIFESIFEFLVQFKFDSEYKQKVFDMLFKSIDKFPQNKKKILFYISDHINDLYFSSCFSFLDLTIKELILTDKHTVNDALRNFMLYEEFAIKLYLERIEAALKQETSQQIEQAVNPYEKLKLLIMTEYENQEIQGIASALIEQQSFLKFTVSDLNEIDFSLVIFDIPKDLHTIVNKVFAKIFDNLKDNEQKRTFVKTILEAFHKILTLSKEEYKTEESQERLELFPNIIKSLLSHIEDDFVKRIYECLILTESQNFTQLTQTTLNLGITILHSKKPLLKDMVKYFQLVLQKEKGLMSPLIFIGECTKLDSSLSEEFKNLDQDILKLLNHKNLDFHINLAQFLRVLISFFNQPEKLVLKLIEETKNFEDQEQINIQCNFIAGLLKGLGIEYVEKYNIITNIHDMLNKSSKKDMREITIGTRLYAVFMIKAMWNVFKKLLEPKMSQIISILVQFLGDFDFQVREQSKSILDMLMKSMSNYSIKLCIPILLKGTDDKNWRTKLNSIQGLAAVSYCGIKQLSENLPVIVPKLTLKINDTNEEIREAALKSLSLILSTIKNPEISEIRDIIIKSLSDPYLYNQLSLEALMNIRFRHYIDGPSLSLIIPILTYGLKNTKNSEYKQKSAKIVANIFSLIQNDSDIWPHIENLIESLKCALKDVDNEVRALASKAFKSIGVRFPNLSNFMLNKIKETLVEENTISIAKSGHAQAFAEVLSTQNQQTIENIFQNMIELTQDRRDHVRESFLSVFVYLPIVFGNKYKKYVKQTTDIVIQSISCEVEILRNLAIKAIKMLIHNFFEDYQDYFIEIIYQKSIEEDPIVRKSAQILNGDIVEILMNTIDDREQIYIQYPRVFALLYIMKNDSSAEVRFVSSNIFKNFIDNTPKCIKQIFGSLMEIFMELYGQNEESATDIANQGYKEFVLKYGNNYLTNILNYMIQIKKSGDVEKIRSVSTLMKYFVEYFNKGSLNKTKIQNMSQFLSELFSHEDEVVWQNAISGMVFLSEGTNTVGFLRKNIKKLINEIENADKLKDIAEEEDEEDDDENEEINSKQNEEENEDGQEDEEETQEQLVERGIKEAEKSEFEKVKKEEENSKNEDQEEENEDNEGDDEKGEDEDDEEDDENSPQLLEQNKLVQLICQLLESDVIKIVNFANDFVFLDPFKEWQVQIMVVHARVYGSLLYQHKDMQEGIKMFIEYYEDHPDLEFQDIFLYLCTEMCKNFDVSVTTMFLDNIQAKLTQYCQTKNFRMLFFMLEMLRGFLEGADMSLSKKTLKVAWLTALLLNYTENGKQFLLDKTIEIIKVSTNIVSQERSGELITDIVQNIKRQIENTKEGKDQPWLKDEKLIGIYLNLIAKVLRSQETHVSVQGVDGLIYFLEILDDGVISHFKENIYGYILRALSYQHTDNLYKKVFILFNLMLDRKHFPDEIQQYLFMYLIHTLNEIQSETLILEDIIQYTHRMIEDTETEFAFLKKWKKKILTDGMYQSDKLLRFTAWRKEKSSVYKEFVDNITE